MRTLGFLVFAITLLGPPALAQVSAPVAVPEMKSGKETPKTAGAAREWEVGASIFGFGNGNFIEQPKGVDKDEPYPGFAGAGGGAGIGMTAMWRGILGLEIQFMYSKENAEGALNFPGGTITLQMEQSSLHIPLTFKLAAPTKSVRPFLFVGPDFVFPESEGTTDPPNVSFVNTNPVGNAPTNQLLIGAHADDYMAWTFGFGFDFLLDLDGQDIRIPLTFRGAYNPDLPVKASERTRMTTTSKDYLSEWEWQAVISLGVSIYFL